MTTKFYTTCLKIPKFFELFQPTCRSDSSHRAWSAVWGRTLASICRPRDQFWAGCWAASRSRWATRTRRLGSPPPPGTWMSWSSRLKMWNKNKTGWTTIIMAWIYRLKTAMLIGSLYVCCLFLHCVMPFQHWKFHLRKNPFYIGCKVESST